MPWAIPRTPGYIAPSRRSSCSVCGMVVQRSHTSRPEIVCKQCRVIKPKPPPRPASDYQERNCPLCSLLFKPKQYDQRYCSMDCRRTLQRTNWGDTPSNPKYKTREHRQERAKWVSLMAQHGYLTCAQPHCLMPTRVINDGDRWHLGHAEDGQTYIGPTHARCNVVDGAKRGNQRSRGIARRWRL